MEAINNLIQTVGLNYSFFYHLLIAATLFFISKKWLWKPYIQEMDKRTQLTKGRIDSTKDLDLKIQANRGLYEKKAKSIHRKFQTIFNKIKEDSLTYFSKQSLKIEEEHQERLRQKRQTLKQKAKEQDELLKKELPALRDLLLNKIRN